jgi:carboxypeptidase Q
MQLRLLLPIVALCLIPPAAHAGRKERLRQDHLIREALPQLLGRALSSDRAWEDLVALADGIGPRLAGSEGLDRAIAWALGRMRVAGFDAPHAEEVLVPSWVRGDEAATMLEPTVRELSMLGLGGSVGTGGPIEADVVVVGSFDELAALPDEAIAGRMVLWDVPFTTYGETVRYRGRGASAAARRGAVASLVRSVTPVSLGAPHTGAMRYAPDAPQIPAAALTVEDAGSIRRLADRGIRVRVRLEMEARFAEEVPSANVVGDVLGRELPGEVVVIACHLDSWDVGSGAQDDGVGCAMVLEAARLIAELPVRPRRTVRVILYTNEENGGRGGKAYAAAHRHEIDHLYAALESDLGSGAPVGWRLDVRGGADEAADEARRLALEERLAPLQRALAPLGAGGLRAGWSGSDIGPIVALGVPGLGLDVDSSDYWPIHHTAADTVDKVDPLLLSRNVAVVAMTAFWLAELEGPLVP